MTMQLNRECAACIRGPDKDRCKLAVECEANGKYIHFIRVRSWDEDTQHDKRMDIIGQNGNEGLHYPEPAEPKISQNQNDGSTASYYELPAGAKELQDLISAKDMNAQLGEIFRACYRYGYCPHSPKLREIKKIIFYAQAELARLEKLEIKTPALMQTSKPGSWLPAKRVKHVTRKEGGTWEVPGLLLPPLIVTTEIPNIKGYAAIRFEDGSTYDYILGSWR